LNIKMYHHYDVNEPNDSVEETPEEPNKEKEEAFFADETDTVLHALASRIINLQPFHAPDKEEGTLTFSMAEWFKILELAKEYIEAID
jgi:hypothetical protein